MEHYDFPRQVRLLRPGDYRFVFDDPVVKVPLPELLLLARPNELGHPRIGIVISKKNARQAVQRNRFKRHVREYFRLNRHELPGLDIVCLARREIVNLDNASLRVRLEKAFRKLKERHERFRAG
ncbi:ribonuclease P protein component [Hahella sp. SMD15-11]|uniref:Ribonuclease P protein component n=1 Tax=Thermohahella caldifontis TaxID=3142973 RepID=A0AB39UTU2_9GAMM